MSVPVVPEMTDFQNRVRRFFDDAFGVSPRLENLGWAPAVEFVEGEEEFELTAELPGVKRDDVSVEVEEEVLTLRGEKRDERTEQDKEKDFHLVERTYGSFQRSFTLPRTVDVERITGTFHDGVLTVRLPKSKEARTRSRRISIGNGEHMPAERAGGDATRT